MEDTATIPSTITVRLPLSSDLLSHYESQAKIMNLSLEDTLAARLSEHKDHSTYNGRNLILSPEQRQEIEKGISRSLRAPEEFVHVVRSSLSIDIDDRDIPLSPELLRRLKTRCIRQPFRDFMKNTIVRQLEHFVGLR